MPDVLRFTTAIDPARTTRLDLNDQVTWFRRTAEFGTPPMVRAEVATMLLDGERYPSARYGNRSLKLTLFLSAASGDAAATQIQALMRELNRPFNILEWKRTGAVNPVFFRTFRTAPDAVEEFVEENRKGVSVELTAEPFAYGLPEVPAGSPYTISNNPAAGGNQQYVDVTGVKGDVAAATQIVGDFSQWFNTPGWIAMRRRGTPANAPFLTQAESATLGTDTTLPGNDATMSGAGSNYARTSFATSAAMVTRLSGTFAGASAFTDVRGQYRVFARYRKSVAGDSIKLTFKVGTVDNGSANKILAENVALESTTSARYADLGILQFPIGIDPIYDGPSGVELTAQPNDHLWALQAQRVSGTGNVDVDYLVLIPADDQFVLINQGSDNTDRTVFDSWADQAYAKSVLTGRLTPATDITALGGMPELAPNVTNRIYVRAGYLNTTTAAIDVKYWPRYLHVRPAAT